MKRTWFYSLYGMDFEELPSKRGDTDEANDSKYSSSSHLPMRNEEKEKYSEITFFYPANFYIACDKGGRGYDSVLSMFECHVESSDNEYNITIIEVHNPDTLVRITEAVNANHHSISHFFNEHLTTNLDKFDATVNEIIRCAKETVFLDLDEQSDYHRIPVVISGDKYSLNTEDYKKIGDNFAVGEIDEGSYIFNKPMRNVVEIAQIEYFAHTPYAKFYAVVKPVFIFPRDKAEIQDRFPGFFMEHCISNYEAEKNTLVKNAVTVPYIPDDNQLGDTVVYRKLSFGRSGCIVKVDIFHILVGYSGFVSAFDNGKDNKIRASKDSLNASLIQVGDKFKILFYGYDNAVDYNGEYYGRFKYNAESEFFTDFSGCPTGVNWFAPLYRQAYKGIEYLLYEGRIKPIRISHERYEEFKRKG